MVSAQVQHLILECKQGDFYILFFLHDPFSNIEGLKVLLEIRNLKPTLCNYTMSMQSQIISVKMSSLKLSAVLT